MAMEFNVLARDLRPPVSKMLLFAADNQEAADLHVQAFRLAEERGTTEQPLTVPTLLTEANRSAARAASCASASTT